MPTVLNALKHIAALIENGGEMTLGRLAAIDQCVATATDDSQCVAMLVRRKGERLEALLRRLDAAINEAYENDHIGRSPSSRYRDLGATTAHAQQAN